MCRTFNFGEQVEALARLSRGVVSWFQGRGEAAWSSSQTPMGASPPQGASHGQFYKKYLATIHLNNEFVPFTTIDLSFLKDRQYKAYWDSTLEQALVLKVEDAMKATGVVKVSMPPLRGRHEAAGKGRGATSMADLPPSGFLICLLPTGPVPEPGGIRGHHWEARDVAGVEGRCAQGSIRGGVTTGSETAVSSKGQSARRILADGTRPHAWDALPFESDPALITPMCRNVGRELSPSGTRKPAFSSPQARASKPPSASPGRCVDRCPPRFLLLPS